jgi:hypothetical protein
MHPYRDAINVADYTDSRGISLYVAETLVSAGEAKASPTGYIYLPFSYVVACPIGYAP